MHRGDIVVVAIPGSYGKPRPAVVVQSDLFNELPSVTLLPITSDLREVPTFRITVEPSELNGLRKKSQIMVDKIMTVPVEKVAGAIGKLDTRKMQEVSRVMAVFLGIVE